jgi:hypothetical protein
VVERLHALLLDHGEEVLRDALASASAAQSFTIPAVERGIEERLRAPQQPRPQGATRGAHARGQLVLFPRSAARARRPAGAS